MARYLAEADTLRRTKVLCGVSGGSVAVAAIVSALAEHGEATLSSPGFSERVLEPFVTAVGAANLRQRALGRWLTGRLMLRGQPRNLVLAETLAEALFPSAGALRDLPATPQVIIAGTELAAGRAFRFSRDFIGSFDLGYAAPPATMTTAAAVAASAAAPPLIPPLQLATAGLGLRKPPERLAITDGGVYDNLGIEWFQGWRSDRRPPEAVAASDLIVVNASGPLRRTDRALHGWRALNRMRKVQYAQTQATRVRWLVQELEAERQHGLYFGIVRDPRTYQLPGGEPIDPKLTTAALPSSLVGPLADLRTDFNRFSATEARLLAYHGYWSAHARFGSLRPDQSVAGPEWREFAGMSERDAARIEHELRGRRHTVGVGERLR